jgi:hypothetical protein
VAGLEAEGAGGFVKGGEAMRRGKVLLDQLGIEGNAIKAAQAAEQPYHLLILQSSL